MTQRNTNTADTTGSVGTTAAVAAAGFLLLVIVLADGAAAGVTSALTFGLSSGTGGGSSGSPSSGSASSGGSNAGAEASPQPLPTSAAASQIPAHYLQLYVAAASTCPGLGWNILAAVGTVETDNGQSTLPGVHSGANSAGAEGPMQFEPATFTEYDQPVPPGGADPPSPYDPADAIYAAARDLCANGARGNVNIPAALFAYNHANWYVTEVLAFAASYAPSSWDVPRR